MTTELSERLGDATTILLGAPSMTAGADDACLDLLSLPGSGATSVLWVSFRKSPDECLAGWRDRHGSDPEEFGVVVVGETTGSGASDVDRGAVETVSTPSDLTGIGIEVGEFVSGRDGDIAVCFDSVTALLQYVDLETAYEFLHALTGRLYSAGAVSHFHVDPNAHEERTVETLLSLFDAEVDLGPDEPEIRTRHPPE